MASISLHVKAIIPPDAKWEQMKAVYDACKEAKIDPPKEVEKFFNYETPDSQGVLIDLDKKSQRWGKEGYDGLEVKLSDLPAHAKVIRFYVSY